MNKISEDPLSNILLYLGPRDVASYGSTHRRADEVVRRLLHRDAPFRDQMLVNTVRLGLPPEGRRLACFLDSTPQLQLHKWALNTHPITQELLLKRAIHTPDPHVVKVLSSCVAPSLVVLLKEALLQENEQVIQACHTLLTPPLDPLLLIDLLKIAMRKKHRESVQTLCSLVQSAPPLDAQQLQSLMQEGCFYQSQQTIEMLMTQGKGDDLHRLIGAAYLGLYAEVDAWLERTPIAAPSDLQYSCIPIEEPHASLQTTEPSAAALHSIICTAAAMGQQPELIQKFGISSGENLLHYRLIRSVWRNDPTLLPPLQGPPFCDPNQLSADEGRDPFSRRIAYECALYKIIHEGWTPLLGHFLSLTQGTLEGLEQSSTTLHHAVRGGHLSTLMTLLEEIPERTCETLDQAVAEEQYSLIPPLCEEASVPTQALVKLLEQVALEGNDKAAAPLLSLLSAREDFRFDPLFLYQAIERGNAEIVELCMQHFGQKIPVHQVAKALKQAASQGKKEILLVLLARNGDFARQSLNYALVDALREQEKPCVKILLEAGRQHPLFACWGAVGASWVEAVVCHPPLQWLPTAASLSLEQRNDLLGWASSSGNLPAVEALLNSGQLSQAGIAEALVDGAARGYSQVIHLLIPHLIHAQQAIERARIANAQAQNHSLGST